MAQIELNGTWQLTSPQRPDIDIPMNLPGDNVSALLQAELIPNPYFADNEAKVRWIEECDWHIERQFEVGDSTLRASHIWMTLTRVDTLAQFFINGERVLTSSNMFAQQRVDIKPYLKQGTNTIRVEFARVDLEGIARAKKTAISYSIGNGQQPNSTHEFDPQNTMPFWMGLGHLFDGIGHLRPNPNRCSDRHLVKKCLNRAAMASRWQCDFRRAGGSANRQPKPSCYRGI